MLLRYCLATLLIFIHVPVLACELRILYGPYVTLLMVENKLADVHGALAAQSGCTVQFTITNSFEMLLDKLVVQDHHFAILPYTHADVSLEMGYE